MSATRDEMAWGYIVSPSERKAWEVRVGSALSRGYWDVINGAPYELPADYEVIPNIEKEAS